MNITPKDVRVKWHEDGERIVVEIPATWSLTGYQQRKDMTYVTVRQEEPRP